MKRKDIKIRLKLHEEELFSLLSGREEEHILCYTDKPNARIWVVLKKVQPDEE